MLTVNSTRFVKCILMQGGIFKKSDVRGKAYAISRTPSGE